ncbi:hypothetical protein WJX72_000289 [[Myrmecia] bisecta]|uniref:Fe2OG dioxygenase domain-containing protein n=1 Tax=[Myrmecia] bisecta TaxID=41462 RepID=A0AAW1PF33_9CHLO
MSEYSRPKDDQHTRHLWVGNAGPGVAGGRCFYLGYAARKERQSKVLPPVALTAEACGVEGLALYPEFVTPEEEAQLLAAVEEGPWETLARRRVQHYGFKFAYKLRNVDRSQPGQPFPTSVQPIAARMQQLAGMPVLDQLTVNEYPAGVGLSPHVDTHSAFTGAIASLSLAGPAVMEFRQGDDHRPLFLPARSLVVLGGEARYAWQHYIPHRKADWVNGELVARGTRRVSFTFRQARGFPCDCQYHAGCGNGKYFGVREDIAVLGSDRSIGLAEVAAKRLLPVVPGQQVSLRADLVTSFYDKSNWCVVFTQTA